MLVNPIYGTSGSSPTPTGLLPEMDGIKYFYDFTTITTGGTIDVPNALETVAPLHLYSSVVSDNGIKLSGMSNNSWGDLVTDLDRDFTLYVVVKEFSPYDMILSFGNNDSLGRWDQSYAIKIRTDYSSIPPSLYSDNQVGYLNGTTTRYNYATLAMTCSSDQSGGGLCLTGLLNNPDHTDEVQPIAFVKGSTSYYNDGHLYLARYQSSSGVSCNNVYRLLAIANKCQTPEEVVTNLAYISKEYVSKYMT